MLRPLLLTLLASAVQAAVLADQAMRYVNNEVITMGDISLRNHMRLSEYQRRGLVIPGTRAELVAFSKQTLEDLTDEALMAQEAKTLGIKNDHEEVVREVLEASKRAGSAFTLRDQAEQRRMMERANVVQNVLAYYEGKMPQPSPRALEEQYRKHRGEFNRPPRARVLQIVLHPSPPEQRQELRLAKNALLRHAQGVTDGPVAEATRLHLESFLQAPPAGQEAVLDELVRDLRALAGREGLDEAAKTVVAEAEGIATRQARLRTQAEVQAALGVVRMQLAGRWGRDLEDAFREQARALSQGPNAEQGGQLGWVEPGAYSKSFDDMVFNLPAGGLSPVFSSGPAVCVVLVAERVEARTRSFDEVSGELTLSEQRRRRDEVRRQLVKILRTQAMIRDVVAVDAALER